MDIKEQIKKKYIFLNDLLLSCYGFRWKKSVKR